MKVVAQQGKAISELAACEFLIVRDQMEGESDLSPPAILGMNIAQRCRLLALDKFDNAPNGALNSDWWYAFSEV